MGVPTHKYVTMHAFMGVLNKMFCQQQATTKAKEPQPEADAKALKTSTTATGHQMNCMAQRGYTHIGDYEFCCDEEELCIAHLHREGASGADARAVAAHRQAQVAPHLCAAAAVRHQPDRFFVAEHPRFRSKYDPMGMVKPNETEVQLMLTDVLRARLFCHEDLPIYSKGTGVVCTDQAGIRGHEYIIRFLGVIYAPWT